MSPLEHWPVSACGRCSHLSSDLFTSTVSLLSLHPNFILRLLPLPVRPFLCHRSDIAPLPRLTFSCSYQCPYFLCLKPSLPLGSPGSSLQLDPLPPIFFFSSLNQYRHLSPEVLLLSVPITLFLSFLLGLQLHHPFHY